MALRKGHIADTGTAETWGVAYNKFGTTLDCVGTHRYVWDSSNEWELFNGAIQHRRTFPFNTGAVKSLATLGPPTDGMLLPIHSCPLLAYDFLVLPIGV